uniref:Uncharacterized protein n=1 Tax=candidate division WWE3 bacterium TaxID=2053526 RepID=A0A7C4XNM5_UNCKA
MRGISAPLLLILIAGLIVGSFFVYKISKNPQNNVYGVNTQADNSEMGLQISVVSGNTSWEMLKYLCVSESDCLESLDAGRRLSKLSGSPTELRDVSVVPEDFWKEFKFLKVYVRSSLNLMGGGFDVLSQGEVPGTLIKKIPFGSENVSVVLIPVEPLFNSYHKSATFSDR